LTGAVLAEVFLRGRALYVRLQYLELSLGLIVPAPDMSEGRGGSSTEQTYGHSGIMKKRDALLHRAFFFALDPGPSGLSEDRLCRARARFVR